MDTYEKKYKKSLERARIWQDHLNESGDKDYADELNYIFPELVESEDEKVRKSLIDLVINYGDRYGNKQNMLAWLEKQGEHLDKIAQRARTEKQRVLLTETNGDANIDWDTRSLQDVKLLLKYGLNYINDFEKLSEQKQDPCEHCKDCVKNADKVEPKFHQGDWIVFNGLVLLIKEVVPGYYRTISIGGIPNSYDWDIDNLARHWTIQDAKDGDVLFFLPPKGYEGGEQIFIFKSVNSRDYVDDCIEFYCHVCEGVFYENKNGYMDRTSSPLYPATKEQRDTLMKAMSDAGYTFDFEKKELKKIEQKPAWSEEDELMLEASIGFIKSSPYPYSGDTFRGEISKVEAENWLKSLKERVQPQNTWKPSEEQMMALNAITVNGCISYTGQGQDLVTLYYDLKKLKEE